MKLTSHWFLILYHISISLNTTFVSPFFIVIVYIFNFPHQNYTNIRNKREEDKYIVFGDR